jgi:hypothetical protein
VTRRDLEVFNGLAARTKTVSWSPAVQQRIQSLSAPLVAENATPQKLKLGNCPPDCGAPFLIPRILNFSN